MNSRSAKDKERSRERAEVKTREAKAAKEIVLKAGSYEIWFGDVLLGMSYDSVAGSNCISIPPAPISARAFLRLFHLRFRFFSLLFSICSTQAKIPRQVEGSAKRRFKHQVAMCTFKGVNHDVDSMRSPGHRPRQ